MNIKQKYYVYFLNGTILGASCSRRDFGRGYTAPQWARYLGRDLCAESIEKFVRTAAVPGVSLADILADPRTVMKNVDKSSSSPSRSRRKTNKIKRKSYKAQLFSIKIVNKIIASVLVQKKYTQLHKGQSFKFTHKIYSMMLQMPFNPRVKKKRYNQHRLSYQAMCKVSLENHQRLEDQSHQFTRHDSIHKSVSQLLKISLRVSGRSKCSLLET